MGKLTNVRIGNSTRGFREFIVRAFRIITDNPQFWNQLQEELSIPLQTLFFKKRMESIRFDSRESILRIICVTPLVYGAMVLVRVSDNRTLSTLNTLNT